jgi:c-di-GMP-binding flagellar brake protein YcgR
MRPRRLVSPRDAATIFDRAVQDRALAVLTLQDGSDWLSFKSRFLERDSKSRFFVLDYQAFDNEPLPALTPGQYLGVSFRQKSRKLLFATVVEAKGHFILDEKTSVAAVRYRWPDSITELQRRAYYRTPIRDDMTLLVNLWPGGVGARGDPHTTTQRVATGELADLSCGGALVRLHQQAPPDFAPDQTLGVELQLPDGRTPIVVDALYRGARSDESGMLRAAIQFIGLELSVDGRLVLQRLANSVQRLHRLTFAAGRGV